MNVTEIRDYMRQVFPDCIDPLTGEVSCTQLAEDAMVHFEADEDDVEEYFELAYEIAVIENHR